MFKRLKRYFEYRRSLRTAAEPREGEASVEVGGAVFRLKFWMAYHWVPRSEDGSPYDAAQQWVAECDSAHLAGDCALCDGSELGYVGGEILPDTTKDVTNAEA